MSEMRDEPINTFSIGFREEGFNEFPYSRLVAQRFHTDHLEIELDADQFFDRNPLAAELDVRVDKELTTFLARVHRDNLAKFLPIVTDVVLHPRWDPEEFRRLRDAAVNDIEKRLRQGDDENLGKESLQESMFRGHPYERLTLGHVSDLKSMSLQELQQHAGRVFTADRLTVGVAGGYPQNLGSDMAQALSALPPRSQPPAALG